MWQRDKPPAAAGAREGNAAPIAAAPDAAGNGLSGGAAGDGAGSASPDEGNAERL